MSHSEASSARLGTLVGNPVQAVLVLRQILDQTDAVVFWKDLAGRYLFVNQGFCALLGKSAGEIVGRRDREVMPGEMAVRFELNDRLVVERRQAMAFEEQGVFGGELRTYLVNKFPLLDPAGEPYAVCGIATDITGRKRFEEAVRAAALAVSRAEGEQLLDGLVRDLAGILDVDVALIATFAPQRDMMRTLALWMDGRVADNIDYPLEGTPCALVVGHTFQFFADGLVERFPGDNMFKTLGACSYAAFPLNDAQGRPLGLVAAISRRPMVERDLAESILKLFAARAAAEISRRQADEARRCSEASYRNIFDSSEDAIFVHDWETGAIVDVNPKACRMYGYTREEMLKLSVDDLSSGVPPYTGADAAGWIAKAEAGERVQVEWHRRNKDGSLHWDEVILCRAEIGGQPRILAFTREITQRKLSAEALQASEERLRATIQAALDPMIGMDAQGVVIEFNVAAEQCFGYRREDALGRALAELIIPERHREGHRRGMRHYLTHGDGPYLGRRVEVEAMRADGSEFPAELAISVAHRRQGPIFIGYMRDITELKKAEAERARLEAQLRQAQKMEAIGHLTGGIAHDFNNILTSINGYLALAAEREEALGDARLARYLGLAHSAADKARDLIRQMLTFSRGQRGTPRPLRLAEAVDEVARFLRPMLPSSLVFEALPGDCTSEVMADPVLIEQVLMNLCINARDALAERGAIRVVAVGRETLGGVCASCRGAIAGDFVSLQVEDDGPGIPPEVLDRMFEPFFSTKAVGKGSGMGLATVHGIVHELGGHIVVDTAPGRGTIFRVLLPELATGHATPTAGRGPHGGISACKLSGRVLVAEDEALVAGFLGELLSGWGLDVTVMPDGRAARDAFAARPEAFDLVMTDQTMPGMSGVELAGEVRRLRPKLPVVVLSAYADGMSRAAVQEAGIDLVLQKPVDPRELFARLAPLLYGAG